MRKEGAENKRQLGKSLVPAVGMFVLSNPKTDFDTCWLGFSKILGKPEKNLGVAGQPRKLNWIQTLESFFGSDSNWHLIPL